MEHTAGPQIFDVFFFRCVATTENDQIIPRILRLPWQDDPLRDLSTCHFSKMKDICHLAASSGNAGVGATDGPPVGAVVGADDGAAVGADVGASGQSFIPIISVGTTGFC